MKNVTFRPSPAEVLAKQFTEEILRSPLEIRAFGGVLTRSKNDEDFNGEGHWSGLVRGGYTVYLVRNAEGWKATALVSDVSVVPHLYSSSYPAALRNLRGHLHNLQISLTKMLRLKGRK